MTPKPLLRAARYGKTLSIFSALAVLPAISLANMGNSPSTYGLLPKDIASAQALSLFNSQTSAVYYNPAALAQDGRGELSLGMLHAEHDLKANGKTIYDSPSQQVQVGMKTNLSDLTDSQHPIYFAFMAGVEKYGGEMMSFSSSASTHGQYMQYGRQPLFLSLGGATKIWRGIDAGVAVRATLHSTAKLKTYTDLAGNMDYEDLDVSAEPVLRPILGVSMNVGETFCPNANCWMDNVDVALSYRARSNTKMKINANTIIPGTIPDPGLSLAVVTLDSFQPDITALGVKYDLGRSRIAGTLEYQAWQRLSKELKKDTIKGDAGINPQDILIPRVAVEFDLDNIFTFTLGAAYEKAALHKDLRSTPNINYLDANKTILGLGLTAELPKIRGIAKPIRLDVGYQYHNLSKRNFELSSTHPSTPASPYGRVRTSGDVHVFAGSITMKF